MDIFFVFTWQIDMKEPDTPVRAFPKSFVLISLILELLLISYICGQQSIAVFVKGK